MQEVVKRKSPMVRKQVLITADQNLRLKELAVASGVTEAEILRRALCTALAEQADNSIWKQNLMASAGMLEDNDRLEVVISENRLRWRRRVDETRRKSR